MRRWSERCARWSLLFVAFAHGCGGCSDSHERADASAVNDTTALPPDVAIDAQVVIDPACAGTSPSCTTSPDTLLSIPDTSEFANMAVVHDTLYVSTYEIVNNGSPMVSAGRIVAVDLVTGTSSTLLPSTVSYAVWAADGWAYAAEDAPNGAIWRFRPGVAPIALVTDRPHPYVITADATHVYWSEQVSPGVNAIKRRLLAGGTIEPVMDCDSAWSLVLDDTYVYCMQLGQNLYRASKSGGDRTHIAGSTYPQSGMVRCNSTLYTARLGERTIDQIPTPAGPNSTFATVAGLGGFYGLTATQNHFFVTTGGAGVYRIDRSTMSNVLLAPSNFSEANPVVWNGRLLFLERDVGVRRCVD